MKHRNNWIIRKMNVMKALRRGFLWSSFKENAILAKGFSFCLTLLQIDLTWGSNVNLSSIWIPRIFSYLLLDISIPPMFTLNFLLIWISSFWMLQKLSIFISKTFWFYFINSNDFFEIRSSKNVLRQFTFFEYFSCLNMFRNH